MEFLYEYGVFLAKALTIVAAILIVVGGIVSAGSRVKKGPEGHLEIEKLNDHLADMKDAISHAAMSKHEWKQQHKARKKEAKEAAKKAKHEPEAEVRKRLYVLNFDGDIRASAVDHLRQEVTSVLSIASDKDEVLIRLESAGGMVYSYGLAASQLQRVKDKGIPLTIAVDKVAASGGYMMACIADKIIAAPFAILGSIGVVAQLPNFHRLLKKHDIDFELITAGEHKRTLTVFGENTEKGRQKFVEDIEDTHLLFKEFVSEHREQVQIEEVANGDVWFGRRAMGVNLIDEIKTSDEYIMQACDSADVFEVKFVQKKSLPEKLGLAAEGTADRLLTRWWSKLQQARWMS